VGEAEVPRTGFKEVCQKLKRRGLLEQILNCVGLNF